jgi:hypothetical protein
MGNVLPKPKEGGNVGKGARVAQCVPFYLTDLPLIADVTNIRTTLPPESQAELGFLAGKRVLQILSKYLSDFFAFVFRGKEGEGLLAGPSDSYPEVVFLG